MKKPKLILLTLVVAIMLVGAGYAAWQETLTISNTVSTGELNMEFTKHDFFGIPIYPVGGVYDNLLLHKNYLELTGSQDEANDMVTISVTDMYPGSTFFYELRADNKGSIPAKVESVTVDLSNTVDLFDETIKVSGYILHRRPGKLFSVNRLPLLNVELSNLQTYLDDGMKNWKIDIGDYIVFDLPDEEEHPGFRDELAKVIPGYDPETTNCLHFHMPKEADNELQSENLLPQKFSIKFNFKQFNK